ncbi:MAG: fused MFS/spermidine synthase [Planctomycetes bacterium]|nr:fused MFS/spermidine synthase [Planctomycetota bacterium]
MKAALIGITAMVAAAVTGYTLQDEPYRLRAAFQAADQAALDHRDSPYSNITWVASADENYLQLRFFDRVEGGVCLHPSWGELIALAGKDPHLAHLVPKPEDLPKLPAGPMWPYNWLPDPGTVSNSAYVRLFPAGVLLNQKVMAAAGGDWRAAAPRVMVIGLGSGIGIATLAHHFPKAAITVVDIDQAVIDMVRDHYPLMRWLTTQKLADGSPRLRFVARDARQYLQYDATREKAYDLIVLDAYTSGSTIPPHLMTREFFAQCAAVLDESGMVLANVIGSYERDPQSPGDKRLVTGGAVRTFRAAGLASVWNFPILSSNESPGSFNDTHQRNNIVIASRRKLGPHDNAAGWDRLRGFTLYPELPLGTWMTDSYILIDSEHSRYASAWVPASLLGATDAKLRARMEPEKNAPDAMTAPLSRRSSDRELMDQVFAAVAQTYLGHHLPLPKGWDDRGGANALERRESDWVAFARETFRVSVATAKDSNKHSGEALTGDLPEGRERDAMVPNWIIPDAPLFTDQMPNADIYNN